MSKRQKITEKELMEICGKVALHDDLVACLRALVGEIEVNYMAHHDDVYVNGGPTVKTVNKMIRKAKKLLKAAGVRE